MSKSVIAKLREKFGRSNLFNGDSALEDELTQYISKGQERIAELGEDHRDSELLSGRIIEAEDMLTSLRSRYKPTRHESA